MWRILLTACKWHVSVSTAVDKMLILRLQTINNAGVAAK